MKRLAHAIAIALALIATAHAAEVVVYTSVDDVFARPD
jgi:hypothetical protein